MRILIVGSTYPPQVNGQSVFTQNLAEGMAKNGHDVMVLVPYITGTPRNYTLNGVQIRSTPSIDLGFVHRGLYIAHSYNRIVKDIFETFRPEIVHCQDSAPLSQYLTRVGHQYGLNVLATNHPGPEVWSPFFSKLSAFIIRFGLDRIFWAWILNFLNKLDFVTVPSRAAAAILQAQGLTAPVRPISCGVDLNHFQPNPNLDRLAVRKNYGLDPDKAIFLYVGRLDGEKRVDVLLNAAPYIQNSNVQVAIAGKGSQANELEELTRKLGVDSRVKFLGLVQRANLPELINAVDVFVMPGDVESLSLATLEAMACSRPAVVANSMALPELVEDGKNGYLFQPGNPKDLASKIDQISAEPERWQAMGVFSLYKVSFHSMNCVIQAYERVYMHLTRKSRRSKRYKARVVPDLKKLSGEITTHK